MAFHQISKVPFVGAVFMMFLVGIDDLSKTGPLPLFDAFGENFLRLKPSAINVDKKVGSSSLFVVKGVPSGRSSS